MRGINLEQAQMYTCFIVQLHDGVGYMLLVI